MRLFGLSLVALATFALGSAKAHDAKDIAIEFGGFVHLRGLTCAECGRKAVQAMSKDKFLFAEVDAKGNARGWNEKAAVMVLIWPGPDCVEYLAIVASRDKAEAVRIREVIRTYLEQAPTDPKAPTRIGSVDSFPKGKLPVIHSRNEQRAVVPTLQFFQQGASIALLKQGLNLSYTQKVFVSGSDPTRFAGAFIGRAKSGLSTHFGVIAISWEEGIASSLTDTVWREVVKVLFE